MAERQYGVEIALSLKNRASEPLAQVARQVQQIQSGIHRVTSAFSGFTRGMMQVTGGVLIAEGLKRAFHGIGQEMANANAHQQRMQTQMAGMASLYSGADMQTAAEATANVWDDLVKSAIDVGVEIDSMTNAYQTLLESAMAHGQTMAQTRDLTIGIAHAAIVLGTSTENVAQQAAMFEKGFARARMPLVVMARNMGLLGKSGKALQAILAPDKAEERQRLIAAIMERMAQASAKMPMTWDRIMASMSGIKQEFVEALGKPAFTALMAKLNEWRAWLVQHRDHLQDMAKAWGERIAVGLGVVIEKARAAFGWLTAHWDGIVMALKAAIAIWVANKAWTVASGVAQVAGGVMGAGARLGGMLGITQAVQAASAAAGEGASAWYRAGAGVRQAAASAGLLGVAIGGFYAVFSTTLTVLRAATGSMALANEAIDAGFHKMGAFGQAVWGLTHIFEIGGTLLGAMIREFSGAGPVSLGGLAGAGEAGRRVREQQLAHNFGITSAELWQVSRQHGALPSQVTREMVTDWQHRTGRSPVDEITPEERIRGIVQPSEDVEDAMRGRGGPTIDARGSTFNIKQDFRDQDPDRIAAIFTRDLARMAEVRRQSGYSLAWGM